MPRRVIHDRSNLRGHGTDMVSSARPSLPRPVEPVSQPPAIPQAPQTIDAPPPATYAVPETPRPRLPAIDMDLPGTTSPSYNSLTRLKRSGWYGVRRFALKGVAIGLVVVITGGGLLFSQGYLKLHKVFKGTTGTAAALKANVDPSLLKGEGSGRVNVLLLGRGGGKHQAPDLTDTMILASIDPLNRTSTLISIPRDLWVTIPSSGAMKINAAWQTGEFKQTGRSTPGSTDPKAIQAGFDEVDKVVENVLGIEIHYNMLVDFRAFEQAVNTVGGVTINVPSDLVDPTMAWENAGDATLAHAGIQNFDGKHALIYSRSRETTNDFARAQRQRSILLALKSKVDTLGTLSNPLKISRLMNAFGNNVSTDLSLKDASRLYSLVKKVGDPSTVSVGLADPPNQFVTTGNMNGQSIVLPKTGLFNYIDIQRFVRTQLKDPYIVREHAKVLVLNGTLLPGIATNEASLLGSYGYNVTGAANTPNSGWTQTTLFDLSHGKHKYTKHYLEERYNVTANTVLPDTSIQTNGADFVIIVGSNEALTSQTQAH